ncbi:MAG: rRNA maturation RNase YbeY [Pseudomonadota bacterium]
MITLDMRTEDDAWRVVSDLEAVCTQALDAAAKIARQSGEISLLLTGNDGIKALNKTWRGKDMPTDVLSFPADPIDRPFLGDIAIGYGVSRRDADERGILITQHLSHLLIHGYFHLIGHDHVDDTDATEMESLEIAALASLGWPDPYR